jgi:hypothetical protein
VELAAPELGWKKGLRRRGEGFSLGILAAVICFESRKILIRIRNTDQKIHLVKFS